MAGLFSTFLDSPSFACTSLPFGSPSKRLLFWPLQVHPSPRFTKRRNPFHFIGLSHSTSPVPSSTDFGIVSTQVLSDGSFLFRFGSSSEITRDTELEEADSENEDLGDEKAGNISPNDLGTQGAEKFSIVKVLDGMNEKKVAVKEIGRDSTVNDIIDVPMSVAVDESCTESTFSEGENDMVKGTTSSPFKSSEKLGEDSKQELISVSVSSDKFSDIDKRETSYEALGLIYGLENVAHSDESLIHKGEFETLCSSSVSGLDDSFIEDNITTCLEVLEGSANPVTDLESSLLEDDFAIVEHSSNGSADSSNKQKMASEVKQTSTKVEGHDVAVKDRVESCIVGKIRLSHPLETEPVIDKETSQIILNKESRELVLEQILSGEVAVEIPDDQTGEPNTNEIIGEQVNSEKTREPIIDEITSELIINEQKSELVIDEEITQSVQAEKSSETSLDEEEVEPILDDETSNHILDEKASKLGNHEETNHSTLKEFAKAYGTETSLSDIMSNSFTGAEGTEEHSCNVLNEVTIHKANKRLETSLSREDTSIDEFFLSSGAALLPHPFKALTGGEDAYFVAFQNWFGVADGVSQWSLEGTDPGVYAQELMETCTTIISEGRSDTATTPEEVLRRSVLKTESPGLTTALVAHFDGQVLHVANVGDSSFIVIRNGTIYRKSSPMLHEFHFPLQIVRGDNPSDISQSYTIELDEGDIVVTATDGLFDNLYEQEIVSVVSKLLHVNADNQEIAQVLAARAQEVGSSPSTRSPFADAAKAAGYVGYTGGKLDDIAVVVSIVQRR